MDAGSSNLPLSIRIAIPSAVERQVPAHKFQDFPLQQMKRNGRTEMDIVGEGLDMYLKLAQELTKGAWPHVVNNAVVSGEVQQTLLGLAGLWKGPAPKAEETQTAPTLGSGSPAQDDVPPPSSPERCHQPPKFCN